MIFFVAQNPYPDPIMARAEKPSTLPRIHSMVRWVRDHRKVRWLNTTMTVSHRRESGRLERTARRRSGW